MEKEYKFFARVKIKGKEEHYSIIKIPAEKVTPESMEVTEHGSERNYSKSVIYDSLEDIFKDDSFQGMLDIEKFKTPEWTYTLYFSGIEIEDIEKAIANFKKSNGV